MAREDIIFLHAPSVYDFRKKPIFYGPVSDVVPSSPVFEMYPIGFMTMATHLQKAGYRSRIVNLAVRMLDSEKFDAEAFIKKLDAKVFGIDLHWLPHAHGALEVAKLVKKHHPDAKVLFGGFSSTYFHEELIRYPFVDLVLKGDSTEIPLIELMDALSKDGDVSKVQNLTWKDENGRVRSNPITFVPEDLDWLEFDYSWMIKSVLRTRDIKSALPWKNWDKLPLTSVFTVRGCSYMCAECGGSCQAGRTFLNRQRPAFRSPEKLAEDCERISDFLNAPIFAVGDIRQGGKDYAERFLKSLKERGVDNDMAFEIFFPGGDDFFGMLERYLGTYSMEFSPESHDEHVRRTIGKCFSNEAIEGTVVNAMKHGCDRLDIFFMIGLPEQTRQSALDTAEYARTLYRKVDNDKRLCVFSAPFAPFVDPGSRAFEDPEKWGYRFFARTLEEHRKLLDSPSWKYVLSYETKWMSRDEIAEASYDAAMILNDVLFDRDQISAEEREQRDTRTENARSIMHQIDAIMGVEDLEKREVELYALKARAAEIMESTICKKADLDYKTGAIWRNAPRVVKGLLTSRK